MSTPDLKETKDIDSGEGSGGSKAAKQKETVSNEGVYKYLPLRSDTQQIRLFYVEHVNELGDPEGRLGNFTHSTAPSYQALSYTWGAETPTYHLPITDTTNSKGRGLKVRKNLWEFLRAFGKTHLHKWIWIDQLCINQDDLAERNDQVQRMGDVYAKASEVLIWLEPNAATDKIYNRPADLSKWLERPMRKAILVAELIENAYFDRLWVVQEMVLARSLKVHYRDVVIDWVDLRAILHNPPAGFRNHTMNMRTNWLFEYAGGSRSLNKSSLPLDTLQYFCGSGCRDPRDVIYALQTLWDEKDRQRVDYSRRTTTIFIEAVLMLLTKFLSFQGLMNERRSSFILAQISTHMELDVQGCQNYEEREAFFKAELDRFQVAIAGGGSTAQFAGSKLWQTLREKLFVNPEVKKVPNQGSSKIDPKIAESISMLAQLKLLTEGGQVKGW